MTRQLERKDVLLKIITSAQGDPVTPVQLQKIAFLVGQECGDRLPDDYYKFVPYDFGPFAIDIYKDADELAAQKLISIDQNAVGRWNEFRATYRSSAFDSSVIPGPIADYIERVVVWARSLTFRELVSAIYHHYPEYGINSVYTG